MFLLDTNVISAVAPSKEPRIEDLAEWLHSASPYLFLSVVTAAEVVSGIAKAERLGAATKAQRLRDWWQAIEHIYGQRILQLDLASAHEAGKILDESRAHRPGFEDIAIAAIARVHGYTVLTRNVRHFEPLGVPVRNPFDALPELR